MGNITIFLGINSKNNIIWQQNGICNQIIIFVEIYGKNNGIIKIEHQFTIMYHFSTKFVEKQNKKVL
jgi:hypothetical protein